MSADSDSSANAKTSGVIRIFLDRTYERYDRCTELQHYVLEKLTREETFQTFTLKRNGLPRHHKGDYEERLSEYELTRMPPPKNADKSKEPWDREEYPPRKRLLQLVTEFTEALSATMKGPLPAIMQISDDFFLKKDYDPIDENLRVAEFALGNLVDPFTFHYSELKSSTDDKAQHDTHILRSFMKDNNIKSGMIATFEHDKNILWIRCVHWQKNPQAVYGVSLKVPYNQIRRLIIDVDKKADCATIYFCLNYPVEIRRAKMKSQKGRNMSAFGTEFDRKGRDGERCLSWEGEDSENGRLKQAIADSPVLALTLTDYKDEGFYNVLSRLRSRCKVPEFTHVHKEKRSDYVDPPDVLLHLRTKSGKLNDFSVAYFVQAVFSRGALVKDALLRSEDVRNKFIAKICKQCDKNRIVAVCALERFLNAIDEKRELRDPIKLWDFLVNQVSGDIGTIQKQLDKNEKDGYTLVRKAVVTPSRILLLTPELIMGNRGLRDFVNNSDDVIRVLFRDEDGTQMRKISVGEIIIQKVVGQVLEDGIRIAGRHLCYLGSSNSQLRDNGCYFFEKSQIPDIRKKMGTFKEMSVPKRMSRMGQFFTQAQRVQRPLERKEYRESYDLIGGADLVNEPYTFSDGVGVMSVALGEEFSRSLKLNGCVPSCFQIRYRGFKGVLSVNPMLDEIRAWAEANLSDEDIPKYRNNVVFRSSQKKFDASKNAKLDSAPFEVVKYSAPCQISLNRPMIDILDQVSEIQSYKAHERIWSRIDELFEKQVAKAASSLTSEHYARERLAELPKRIGTSDLKEEDGFMLTQEPFFRSLIMSSVRLSMSKLRKKNNVDIPSNLGRLVYGIVDETGQLQYNQIFCQVSSSIFVKHPKKSALKRILKGPVMMTKNPAIVKGDIRRFEAVDIPELRHLVDVVVFPRYGPRSMPDEMAGSDLDGDEYVIIWDPKFLFDKNEAAMNYPRPLKTFEKVREDEIEKKSCEFFIKYIIQDAVGMLAHAFLANSDYYGIESEVCENVARKHAKALDFPKTGDQPDALTKMPTKSEIYEGKQIPQEKPDRYPDFMEKDHQRCYASIGLNGHIYRRARALDDILHRSVDRHLSDKIEVDPDLIVDGWEDYEDEAKKTMNDYNSQIRSVLETYGIEDEGQLFSGAISKMRSGVGDATQDKDLFGAFNVLSTVSKHVALIFDEFRRSFFDEHGFGGYLHCTDLKYETVGRSDEMHHSYKRTCRKPTLEMKKLASAYYKLTYEAARQESQQAVKLLSFPWTVWDVLAAIKHDVAEEKRRSSDRRDQYMNRRVKPFANLLSEHIAKFCRQRQEDLDDFKNLLVNTDGIIALMLERYEGLVSILFFVCVWADDSNVFSDFFNYQHLCWILILFGQGIYPWNHAKTFHTDLPIFYPIDKLKEVQNVGKEPVNLNHLLGGIGSVILLFLEFLSSYYFGHKMKSISFNPLGLNSSLGSCYLQKLFHAATKTYNEVIFSVSFDTLPQPEEGKVHRSLREFEIEPFMIELPLQKESEGSEARYNLSDVEDQIKEMTGASHVRVRPLNDVFLSGVTRLMVSAKGTLESSQKLRTLLSVMPSCRNEHNAKWGKLFMSERLLMRLNLVHS